VATDHGQQQHAVSLHRGMETSSNLMFQVEHIQSRDGNNFKWQTQLRLRHIGTGKLLAVPESPVLGTHDRMLGCS
jgi:hypothetical protein